MYNETECNGCKGKFNWKKLHAKHERKYCSQKCAVNHKNANQFKWDALDKIQKLQKLKYNFEERVIKKEGCWSWKGGKDKDGYGQMQTASKNKLTKAHRISWMIYKGNIPKGLRICHTCDNTECTNPEHLFIGTAKDNSQDMSKKGRSTKGERSKSAKLKEEDVKEIRKLLKIGVKSVRISQDFDISQSVISGIKTGKIWKHVK